MTQTAERPGESLRSVFSTTNGVLYVFDPSARTLRAVVEAAAAELGPGETHRRPSAENDSETPTPSREGTDAARDAGTATPAVRVVATGSRLREFRDDFGAAALAAELVADDRLGLRATAALDGTPVAASRSQVYVPVVVNGTNTGVAAAAAPFTDEVFRQCASAWEEGTPFDLRTPPLSTIRETLTAEIGPDARADFDAVLTTVERDHDPTAFDPVTAALLVVARHRQLLYDVSNWGADVGLASKATFSRKKNRLEDLGVVETERESVPTGRPRQRLFLTETYRNRIDDEGPASVLAGVLV